MKAAIGRFLCGFFIPIFWLFFLPVGFTVAFWPIIFGLEFREYFTESGQMIAVCGFFNICWLMGISFLVDRE